jgi:hypothetical protein
MSNKIKAVIENLPTKKLGLDGFTGSTRSLRKSCYQCFSKEGIPLNTSYEASIILITRSQGHDRK